MNNCVLQGTIVEDPQIIPIKKDGKVVTNLVKFPLRVAGGKDDNYFIVEAWGDTADYAQRHNFTAGSLVGFTAEARQHKWFDEKLKIDRSDVRFHVIKFASSRRGR